MIISVIGLGYIGLPTAAILASRKVSVVGVDVNSEVIEIINSGKVHFIEPELDIVVHAVVAQKYLRATHQPEAADVFIIAVPTPFKDEHQPDLRYIEKAVRAIAPVLKRGNVVILESTSPVGATECMTQWLMEERPDLSFPLLHGENSDIRVAYCPERVLPGHVLRELVQNDRIIGGLTPACAEAALQIYKIFVEGECIVTDARTAEMCKLTENSFRDINIAFANELSMICDKFNINVWDLIKLANRHPRVNILQPGPGVGGHCIAVDPWFIVSGAPEDSKLIRTAREVNDSKPLWVLDKIQSEINNFLRQRPEKTAQDVTITCLGLAFKADIDDLRESPAVYITQQLALAHAGPVLAVEPNITQLHLGLEKLVALKLLDEALSETDLVVMLVDHKLFREVPVVRWDQYVVVDVRGMYAAHQ